VVLDEQQEYERTLEVAHDALRDLDSGRAKLLSIGWDYEASRINRLSAVDGRGPPYSAPPHETTSARVGRLHSGDYHPTERAKPPVVICQRRRDLPFFRLAKSARDKAGPSISKGRGWAAIGPRSDRSWLCVGCVDLVAFCIDSLPDRLYHVI